jgi:hypothetical protein
MEAVADLGEKLQKLPLPRPTLIFGGQGFEQHPDVVARIPGVYLDGDLQTIVDFIQKLDKKRKAE